METLLNQHTIYKINMTITCTILLYIFEIIFFERNLKSIKSKIFCQGLRALLLKSRFES
jgi:hypothetical protein